MHGLQTHKGQIPNSLRPKFKSQSKKYLWYGYKGNRFFVEMLNNIKHGQGTYSTKMGTDSLAENTLYAPKSIWPVCLPKLKSLGFQWKNLLLKIPKTDEKIAVTSNMHFSYRNAIKVRWVNRQKNFPISFEDMANFSFFLE